MSEHGQLIALNLILLFCLKALCFVLGFLVVKIGADLLREGVKGEFKFGATLTGSSASLKSASPGLLFLSLGLALISFAMWVPKVVPVEYLRPAAHTTSAPAPASESFPIPDLEASAPKSR